MFVNIYIWKCDWIFFWTRWKNATSMCPTFCWNKFVNGAYFMKFTKILRSTKSGYIQTVRIHTYMCTCISLWSCACLCEHAYVSEFHSFCSGWGGIFVIQKCLQSTLCLWWGFGDTPHPKKYRFKLSSSEVAFGAAEGQYISGDVISKKSNCLINKFLIATSFDSCVHVLHWGSWIPFSGLHRGTCEY